MRECEELQQQREATAKLSGRKVVEARASTTDPEARTMKFPDGGCRPGYNVQFATDTASGVIVGVEVTNAGNDGAQLPLMLDQLEERYERVPDEALVDGGFTTTETIDQATERGCTVYAPVKDEEKQRAAGKDPHARKKWDSDATAAWRSRMGTESAKWIYGLRAQTAELVNAQCRNRGLRHMPVRGQPRCSYHRIAVCNYSQSNCDGETALGAGENRCLSAILRKGGQYRKTSLLLSSGHLAIGLYGWPWLSPGRLNRAEMV
jgi:hypothetical protein